jgi:hypothetical protein
MRNPVLPSVLHSCCVIYDLTPIDSDWRSGAAKTWLPTCKQDANTVHIGSGLIPEEHTCVLFEQRQHCVILAVLETRRACLCSQPVGPFFTFTLHALWGLLA